MLATRQKGDAAGNSPGAVADNKHTLNAAAAGWRIHVKRAPYIQIINAHFLTTVRKAQRRS